MNLMMQRILSWISKKQVVRWSNKATIALMLQGSKVLCVNCHYFIRKMIWKACFDSMKVRTRNVNAKAYTSLGQNPVALVLRLCEIDTEVYHIRHWR